MRYSGQTATRCLAALLLLIILSVSGTRSQTYTGSLAGVVSDSSGATIPHVSVRIENKSTGISRSAETGDDGLYNFPSLQPGTYSIRVEAHGFAVSARTAAISVAAALRVDFSLGVAGTQESVTVLGESGVAIETHDAEISTTVSSNQIMQLPTINRDPYAFVAIAPGAGRADPDTRGVGYAVNGQRTASGNYVVDGGENMDTFGAGPGVQVPLDSVQEYRLQTNNYSAEYGRGAGFIANVLTKSGTNNFHGSVYEYNRNSALSANTFNNNANHLPRAHFNRNQVGGAIGGPIIKDKLFFFGNYEGILIRSSQSVKFYVPTPQLLGVSSPGTQAIFQTYPVPTNISTTDVLVRTVCPYGGACPGGTGALTLPAYAATFRTGPHDAGAGPPQDTHLAVVTANYNVSDKTQLAFSYLVQHETQFASVQQAYTRSLDQPVLFRNQHASVSLTHEFSPALSSESRLVYGRVVNIYPLVPSTSFPIFSINSEGGANLPGGLSVFSAYENQYQVSHSMTWDVGKHIFKFGGAITKPQENLTQGSFQDPVAQFADTQGFVDGVLANYLIALNPKGQVPPASVSPPFGPPSFYRPFRYSEPSAFVEDSWRATRRLTLYAGLRYEYFGVVHSAGSASSLDSNYSYGAGMSLQGKIANGTYVAVNNLTGDLKGRFYKPEYLDFSPRLGVAYDVTGNSETVFRAGIGRFYDRTFGNVVYGVAQNPPAYATTHLTNVTVTPNMLTNVYSVFPNSPTTLLTTDGQFLDPNFKNAYTVAWNAGFEHDFGHKFVASAKYLGSSGSHLYIENQINRIGGGVLLGRPNERLNNNTAGIRLRGSEAHSTYHALQLRIESNRLPGIGLQFGASYTYSHSIDNSSNIFGEDNVAPIQDGGFLDPFNPSLDKGNSSFDITHLGSGYFIWDIPYGRNPRSALKRYVLGGWGTSGLVSLQSGMPYSLADTGALNWSGEETTRPTISGAYVSSTRIPDPTAPNVFLILPINNVRDASGNCVTPAPFGCATSVDGPFTAGILGRDTFRRPGTFVNNISFFKNIPGPRESVKVQLRAEFYNLLNHPNLYYSFSSLDVNTKQFNGGTSPGVVASFSDNREIVVALRVSF